MTRPIDSILASLGIPPEEIAARSLLPFEEAQDLEVVAVTPQGREHRLTPEAAAAWRSMHAAAGADGVVLDRKSVV